MASILELDTSILDRSIERAVQSVFEIMIRKPALPTPTPMDPSNYTIILDQIHVVGIVGVVGEITGLIYLYFSQPLAEYCTARMMGLSMQKVTAAGEGMVNNVVGELTNMTLGTFKNQLVDLGFNCRLTLPSVLRDRTFKLTELNHAVRRCYRFDLGGHALLADLLLGSNA
jgi:chemotaxis protein CheX